MWKVWNPPSEHDYWVWLAVNMARDLSTQAGSAEPTSTPERAPFYWHPDVAASFPPAFLAFLKENDIHPDNYRVLDVPRYVRVNPRSSLTVDELERQLQTRCEAVEWLPGFFKLAADVKIAGCEAYRQGDLYGIDVSSSPIAFVLRRVATARARRSGWCQRDCRDPC